MMKDPSTWFLSRLRHLSPPPCQRHLSASIRSLCSFLIWRNEPLFFSQGSLVVTAINHPTRSQTYFIYFKKIFSLVFNLMIGSVFLFSSLLFSISLICLWFLIGCGSQDMTSLPPLLYHLRTCLRGTRLCTEMVFCVRAPTTTTTTRILITLEFLPPPPLSCVLYLIGSMKHPFHCWHAFYFNY